MNTRSLSCLVAALLACGCATQAIHPTAESSAGMAVDNDPQVVSRSGTPLAPPPGFAVPVRALDKDARECPDDAEPYVGELDFPSKFQGSDKARDDLNKAADAEYKRRIAPIRNFERGFNQQVEDYMRAGHAGSLECAIALLDAWSRDDALLGASTTHTGKSMRKWALGSTAASYLRLKFSPSQPLRDDPDVQQQAEQWMDRVAAKVVDEWSDQPLKKVNNHEYWAAWSVMATAVALNDRSYFEWAMKQFRIGASQIDEQGFLPNELSRDTRALYYHNYAITPLLMIAAFARANQEPIADDDARALQRLANRILSGVDDPSAFSQSTGKLQNLADFSSNSKFAWMEIHCWTLGCSEARRERMESLRPLKNYRLGGNLTELFAVRRASS